ncbi:CNRG phosphodiesterase, partial [Oenanthe oenanthe]|nr:CNRG phosphodiesterase [Oenanthe oenanthe]
MSLEPPKPELKSATRVTGGPATPRKGPPKFKQRQTRQQSFFPCRFGDDIPGMEGLGTGMGMPPLWQQGAGAVGVTVPQPLSPLSSDITVICPWEAFSHLELHELAQYGII